MERVRPGQTLDERETLVGLLDFLRATVVAKVEGLTEEQARSQPVSASTMTPMGLVKHLTGVERWWFSIDFGGRDVEPPWPDEPGYDGFELTDEDTVEGVLAAYRAECAAGNAVVAAAGLDDPAAQPPDDPFHLRYALAHMVEETARHCGHLDLMREALDGSRGE